MKCDICDENILIDKFDNHIRTHRNDAAFLSELERELGMLQIMNDSLPTRKDRILKRIRELKAVPTSPRD